MQVAETYTAHHHKDKAATLHVVPEYEDNDDMPTSTSGASDSNSTLPIPRARQAFVPRGSSDGDPPMLGASGQTHLQLPSPTASSTLYSGLPKWGGGSTFESPLIGGPLLRVAQYLSSQAGRQAVLLYVIKIFGDESWHISRLACCTSQQP